VEVLLTVVLLLVLFAVGPFVAMLDVLSHELFQEEAEGVRMSRLAKALVVLFVPFAWIVYFVFVRRRPPFA